MRRKRKHRGPSDPGLGFSPYRQTAKMAHTPSIRALTKKARKQAKQDIEKGDA